MTDYERTDYDDKHRARRVQQNRTALAGALELYSELVTFAIDFADGSGDLPDEWRLPRFTLRGGAIRYYIEPVSDVREAELAAMVRTCDPERAPAGCVVALRYTVPELDRTGTLALEVWAR